MDSGNQLAFFLEGDRFHGGCPGNFWGENVPGGLCSVENFSGELIFHGEISEWECPKELFSVGVRMPIQDYTSLYV